MAKQQRGCQVHGSASCQRTIFYLLIHYKILTACFFQSGYYSLVYRVLKDNMFILPKTMQLDPETTACHHVMT